MSLKERRQARPRPHCRSAACSPHTSRPKGPCLRARLLPWWPDDRQRIEASSQPGSREAPGRTRTCGAAPDSASRLCRVAWIRRRDPSSEPARCCAGWPQIESSFCSGMRMNNPPPAEVPRFFQLPDSAGLAPDTGQAMQERTTRRLPCARVCHDSVPDVASPGCRSRGHACQPLAEAPPLHDRRSAPVLRRNARKRCRSAGAPQPSFRERTCESGRRGSR